MSYISGYQKGINAGKDSISIISCEEKAINNGCFYTASAIITVPANGDIYIAGRTGNSSTKIVWMQLPTINGSQPDLEIYAYYDTVYTGGSNAPIYNHNHQLMNPTSWQEMKVGVSISDIGTKFYDDYIAGATNLGGTTEGGQTEAKEKYKFDFDRTYCLHIHDGGGNDNKLIFRIKWFESPLSGIY